MNPLSMPSTADGHHGRRGERGSGTGPRSGRGRGGPPPWAMLGGPRGRAGRGEVRAAVLLLLAERPRHGYEMISEIADRSDGRWQPSPGSVYPALKRLAAEGLVAAEREGDRRVFDLTPRGRAYVEKNSDDLGEPWTQTDERSDGAAQMFDAARQTAAALWQIGQSGTDHQISAATAVLHDTKRALYRLLADEPTDS